MVGCSALWMLDMAVMVLWKIFGPDTELFVHFVAVQRIKVKTLSGAECFKPYAQALREDVDLSDA